jgi:hypothetical protein
MKKKENVECKKQIEKTWPKKFNSDGDGSIRIKKH